MNYSKALLLLAFFLSPNFVFAENSKDQSTSSAQNRERIRELCEKDPNLTKCEKFLDSEYRRYSDLEKESYKNIQLEEMRLEEVYQREVNRELMLFCRKDPEAPRCKSLKSRPRLKQSFRTVRR